jgi:AcrR family transcriptional regulator
MTAMPKVVDHEERRTELATAVWRLASREGLEAVTVRRVAEEAGWSTGAVVHYFADKEDLLLFAFSTVADRVRTRLAETAERTTEPLELVRAWLIEARSACGSRSWALRSPARRSRALSGSPTAPGAAAWRISSARHSSAAIFALTWTRQLQPPHSWPSWMAYRSRPLSSGAH